MFSTEMKLALLTVTHRLSGSQVTWAVSGSAALALHGIAVAPNDLDLETDAAGAYVIEQRCQDTLIRPVQFIESARIRSHWGALRVGAVQVEVMGHFQVRRADGSWQHASDVGRLRQYVEVDKLRVPVMSLPYLRDAYRLLGRTSKADLIDQWLVSHPAR